MNHWRKLMYALPFVALTGCSDERRTDQATAPTTLAGRWLFTEEISFRCGQSDARIYQSVYPMDIAGSDADFLITTVKDASSTLISGENTVEQRLPLWPFYFDEMNSNWIAFLNYIGQGTLVGTEISWSYSVSGLYRDDQSADFVTWSVDSEYDATYIDQLIQGTTSFELPNGCTGQVSLVAVPN